jgi:hypothetical protein
VAVSLPLIAALRNTPIALSLDGLRKAVQSRLRLALSFCSTRNRPYKKVRHTPLLANAIKIILTGSPALDVPLTYGLISKPYPNRTSISTNSSAEALPMAATSFPRFSSLPPEIRQMIWKHAAASRIVYLEMVQDPKHTCSRVWSETSIDGPESMGFFDLDNQPESARLGQGPYQTWAFRARSIPLLFLVCRESYMVATQKVYTKSFGTEYSLPSTWFNFEHDILYLDWGYYLDDDDDVRFDFNPNDLGEDVKNVRHLAIYNGRYPSNLILGPGIWIDHVLSYFGNVQSLTMTVPQHEDDDCADLVFLDYSDAREHREYLDDEEFLHRPHPVVEELYPDLHKKWDSDCLWEDSVILWEQRPYSLAPTVNHEAGGIASWTKPELQYKPIMSAQKKLEFLQRKQEYDRVRDARRATLTLTAEGYTSLEVCVPLLTTIADLVSMFCQARSIFIETIHTCSVDFYWGDQDLPFEFNNDYSIETKLDQFFPSEHQSTRLNFYFLHE